MYYNYFKYCLEHKLNVFKVCWRKKQYWHAITHDLSKFSFKEFGAYAKYFYDNTTCDNCALRDNCAGAVINKSSCINYRKDKSDFNKAWEHHYLKNKHHWDHWCYDVDAYYQNMGDLEDFRLKSPRFMPIQYIRQMISDWEAMSLKFGGTAQEYYLKNYTKIELDSMTRYFLEDELNLIKNFGMQVDPYCEFCSLDQIIKHSKFDRHLCNRIFSPANNEFNLNIFDLVAPQLEKESDLDGGSKA